MIPKGAQSAYLVVYNSVLALGWAGVCVLSVRSIVENGSLAHVYADAGALARALQLASILETVHAAAGLVQSGVMTNLMQWTARTHALFAIVHANDLMHSSPFAGLMLLAWGFGESFRYPWYACTQMGYCPHWLTWLRYSVFVPVYPVGMLAELKCMRQVLPHLQETRPWSLSMPNKWNIAFDYPSFPVAVMISYPYLWWQLYSMLLRQRRRKLGPQNAEKDAAKKTE